MMSSYYNFTFTTQYGWVCPKCGRVYSPSVAECFGHHSQMHVTFSGTDIPFEIDPTLPPNKMRIGGQLFDIPPQDTDSRD